MGVDRPNWDGTENPAQAERTDEGRIARPDWNGADPDPPTEADEPAEAPKYLVIDEPADKIDEPADEDVLNLPADFVESGKAAAAQYAAETVLDALGDDTALADSFDQLPAEVQATVFRVLAEDSGLIIDEADEAKMASLTNTPEGEELAEEWGDDAAYNLAAAFAKIDAITENMSASDRDAIFDWAGSLSDRETMAVLRGLAE